jgi:CheY-like chemotaxis protein
MSEQSTPSGQKRILIVDDERMNRQVLEVMLGGGGYEIETADSGDEALAAVAKRAPDLILLDIMMPGMDGYRVATKLKTSETTGHIPVILVSALDDRNSRTHGLNVGADGFLTKPVNRADLLALVEVLVADRP